MGWSDCDPGELSERQYGLALGNSWPVPVAARIIFQLNMAMCWSSKATDPMDKLQC